MTKRSQTYARLNGSINKGSKCGTVEPSVGILVFYFMTTQGLYGQGGKRPFQLGQGMLGKVRKTCNGQGENRTLTL